MILRNLQEAWIRFLRREHHVERTVLQGPRLEAKGASRESTPERRPEPAKNPPPRHLGLGVSEPVDRPFSLDAISLYDSKIHRGRRSGHRFRTHIGVRLPADFARVGGVVTAAERQT